MRKRSLLAALALVSASSAVSALTGNLIGRYETNQFDESAAEIVSWHNASQRVLVVNAQSGQVDILDASTLNSKPVNNPLTASTLPMQGSLNLTEDMPALELGAANSVAVHGDLIAVAVEAKNKQDDGIIAFYRMNEKGEAEHLTYRQAGALPDMVTFSPDGNYVVVANEGEPSDNYEVDPEGSITIIDLADGLPAESVRTVGFQAFNDTQLEGVRIFGPGASVAQDLEPEYIAISSDSQTAYVSLQENNALAIVDLKKGEVTQISSLGLKDHSRWAMDASDKDGAVNMQTYDGVLGMYQPDAITLLNVDGKDYLLSANEGDARDYWFDAENMAECLGLGGKEFDEEDGCLAFSEETRAGKLSVEGDVDAAAAADKERLGRLKVTTTLGDADGNGQYENLYAYGGRSFSVWDEEGTLIWDSGDQMEWYSAQRLGMSFNASNDDNTGDMRSDDKGPEPEAITTGIIDGVPYAFVGLERTGGFMIYNMSKPHSPQYVDYIINRDFSVSDMSLAGDLGPEGMYFVGAEKSPTGRSLLIIGNEVSGSTSIYELF